jgi:hypothetical protein
VGFEEESEYKTGARQAGPEERENYVDPARWKDMSSKSVTTQDL